MKLRFVILGLLFALSFLAFANDIPDPMTPARLVNDYAGIYDASQRNSLEQMLRNYNDTTSTQLYVVTVTDLNGYDISDYASRLGEKWGIGKKGKDNGAVILIKPKTDNERGQVFIATGYGLEPILTDARCGRIIDDYMLPHFSNNDYYTGTKAGIMAIISYLSGQFTEDGKNTEETSSVIPWLLAIFVFIAIIVYASKKRK